jgi:hypothetical protein
MEKESKMLFLFACECLSLALIPVQHSRSGAAATSVVDPLLRLCGPT